MKPRPPTFSLLLLLIGCGDGGHSLATHTAGSSPGGSGAVSGGLAGLGGSGGGNSSAGASGASGTSGPAGASGTASSVPATFETVKLVLGGGGGIMPCSAAPCHGVNGMAPPDRPLELPPTDDQQLYTNLIAYLSTACNGTRLVDPGNPTQSALVTILKGPCGATPRMPYGCSTEAGDCIPDEYIAAVAQWIANGAPQR